MVLKLAPLFCRFTWHCPPRLNGYQSLLLFKRPLTTAQETENTNASHSRFLAEASPQSRWKEGAGEVGKGGMEPTGEDFDTLTEGKGKLSPTSSHLFKLILPLGLFTSRNEPKSVANASKIPPPTVFLLHPSQPLSHVSRLILASLSPAEPSISFRSPSHRGDRHFQWSSSTDLGDFIRDAAQTHEFEICISNSPGAVSGFQQKSSSGEHDGAETIIQVEVPTFADRTRFLRRRLDVVTREMDEMNKLKHQCDAEARRGARRVAVGGFGLLVVYWGAVARLTFWDYGWDIMEPITYLSGLSTVILGYLWFLYQGREVSYSSLLHQSISSRRDTLYKSRGFDIDRYLDLVTEAKEIKREIGRIAQDYEGRKNGDEEGEEEKGKKGEEKVDDVDREVEEEEERGGDRERM